MDDATGRDRRLAAWPEGSVLAALIRSRDWSATPLGSIETWSASLRTAAAVMLNARRPTSIVWGPGHNLLYNDALRPLIGAKHPAALGSPLRETFPGVWESIGPALTDAIKTGAVETGRGGGKRLALRPCQPGTDPRTGRERRLAFRLTPIRDDEGSVEGLLIPMRAVAEPDRPDRRSRGERRLASVLSRATIGLAEIGVDGRFLDVNDELCRILGRPREALLALTLPDVTHPDDVASGLHLRERVAETGEQFSLDERYLRPDGAVVWANCNLTRLDGELGGEPGRARALLAVVFDLTERKRAEERVAESGARVRALLERVPQLVWRADGSGQWTWASPQWTAATGLSDEGSRGLGWLDAVHPDDRRATMSAWRQVATRGVLEVEHRLWHVEEGAYRWHQTRAVALRDAPGQVAEWLGTCTDVHGMRRLQDQQDLLIAELQHRTRNLLGIVRGIAVQVEATSRSLQDFSVRFDECLAALGRVQGLLSRQGSITLGELVQLELSAHGVIGDRAGRCRVNGPTVTLPGRTVQMLALALHELTTNAAKHGALATPRGSLDITWWVAVPPSSGEPERLTLTWSEHGVAMEQGTAPARRGFGRELIEVAFPYELDATTHLEFAADGARCRIELPMRRRR